MTATDGGDEIKSAARTLAVLEALNARPVSSIDRLHRATALPKATLVRILSTLAGLGYVYRVSRRDGYALTEKILRLSAGFRYQDALVDAARAPLEAFTRAHKWQVSLGTPDGGLMRVRFNTKFMSPFSPDQMFLNRTVGMLQSALGRAYLAWCAPEEREVVLDLVAEGGAHEASAPPADPRALLEEVRRRRYATIERQPGDRVRSLAVPVFSDTEPDRAVAGLAMFYFASTMSEGEAVRRHLDDLHRLSGEITAAVAHVHGLGHVAAG